MAWQDILGHDEIVEKFRRSISVGKLASTFLFVGPAGIGKRTFAMQLAQALLCETNPESRLEGCGHCSACQQVAAGTHPDLDLVAKPADRSFIPLELFIGDEEHRMREGLCRNISLKPFRGGRKIAIIDDADYLNQEGANSLLKTLEEPPPRSVIILIGTSEQRQLPTIRSRCQIVRFRPLTREQVQSLLVKAGLAESDEEAKRLSELSDGSLQQAEHFADPAVREFRKRLFDFLADGHENPFVFAKDLTAFVDAVGKDAPPRRLRLKHVATMAADFYRELMAALSGSAATSEPELRRSAETAARKWSGDLELVTLRLERCLDVHSQVDANANLATLIECWADDLTQVPTAR